MSNSSKRLTQTIQAHPEILEAYLFGSRARGDSKLQSDIDVAIYVDRDLAPSSPFGYASALAYDLMAALHEDRLDVVVLNDAPPLLYHRVLRDGIRLLARRLEATTSREGRALSRYCDYLLQLRKIDSAHAERIARGDFGRPGRFDAAVIHRHLLVIDEALQTLRRHRGKPVEALASDREELWVVERGLQLCAQNALDIATHLAASAGRDVADYGAAVVQMADLGILPREFATRFRQVAGFRNVIVHGYLDVELHTVHRLLNEHLDDFVEFARHVNRHLLSRADS
jgi:hypothetical protein